MGGRNRITDMAIFRNRANEAFSYPFRWKDRQYIRVLGTDDDNPLQLSELEAAFFDDGQGTVRSDFKFLRSAVNGAASRKPPLLAEFPFTIPKITDATVRPFLPPEEIKREIGSTPEGVLAGLLARWLLGHLDHRTTKRYIHFMPNDKRDTADSMPFEF